MKTLKLYQILSLASVVLLSVTACGSNGGSGNTQNRRFNFNVGVSDILNPIDGDTGVCLQEPIQIEVPDLANLCNNDSGFEQDVILRRKGTSTNIPLTSALKIQDDGDTCVLEMFADAAAPNGAGIVFPQTQYQIFVDLEQSGSIVFDGSEAIEFTTGTYDQNQDCPGAFKVTSPFWEETTVLRTGLKDAQGESIFDADDFQDFFLNTLNGAIGQAIGIGNQVATAPITVQMNESINASSILNGVRLYRIEGSWPVFNSMDSAEAQVSLNALNDSIVEIYGAAFVGFAPGTYVAFVDEVYSNTGKLHTTTAFKIITVSE